MELTDWIGVGVAVVSGLTNIGVLIAAGTKVVGKVETSTSQLSLSIAHLSTSIDRLHTWLGNVETRTNDHAERIAGIEASMRSGRNHD